MRKRTSRRRWKARIRQGKWVPKWAVVEHGLVGAYEWERDFPRDLLRSPQVVIRSTTHFYPNWPMLSNIYTKDSVRYQ